MPANEELVQTLRFGCSPNRQLAGKDAGGSRTHFDRFAAGSLAIWLQRQFSAVNGLAQCFDQESNPERQVRSLA